MKNIKSSLEWDPIKTELLRQTSRLAHGSDIRKMISNISTKITELSKAEVAARRGRSNLAAELLKEINEDLVTVEEFLLVAALLG